MSPLFHINPNILFPFYFIIDKSLHIVDAGDGLLKLYPRIVNDQFRNQFEFKRPFSPLLDFNSILEYRQEVFVLMSTKEENLLFRGQIVFINEHEKIIFIVSPWVTNADEFKKHNLLLTDFALHDRMADMLQIMKLNEMARNDIDELKNTLRAAEKKIKISEEKFRGIIENMELGLLEKTPDGIIIDSNDRFCEMTGYTREELIGEDMIDSIFTGKRFKSKLSLQNLRRALGQSNLFEIQIKKRDEQIIWCLVSEAPLYDANKSIIGSIGIYLDITERKNYEQELKKAKEIAENSKKVKEQFLANMSHEIRTPMNAIIGMAEILQENNLTEEQKECTDAIKLSADNLLLIINDVLDFSKIESGKIIFENRPLILGKILEGVIQTLNFMVNKNSILLAFSISDSVPSIIIGDAVRLRQILLNLCSNSVKFTERGSVRIDVQLKEVKNENYTILFTVTDTGIGISEEKLSSIFESFIQASMDTTRKYGGTGLGLTITKQLIELQGGSISVKSRLNEGSQFSFILTFKKGEEKQLESNENEEIFPYTGLESIKVLIAEDNSMNQILIKKIFNKWKLQYEIVENGKIVIEKLTLADYDIILMDMHMPEMDGYETTKYIRNKMPLTKSTIPIIAVTANAVVGEEDKCISAGMNDYISKPLNKQLLYQKMLKLLGKNNVSDFMKNASETGIVMPVENERYIDLTYLKQIAEGSNDFIIDMINSFLADTPRSLNSMDKALAEKEWPELKVIAHTMKSSIDFIGIHSIKKTIREIEEFAQSKTNLDLLPGLIEKTKLACIQAMEELKAEIKNSF